MNEEFEVWFAVSKYTQVIYPNAQTHQIALDGWQAASQRYESKLAEMQSELNKARELLSGLKIVLDIATTDKSGKKFSYIETRSGSFISALDSINRIDAFLAKDK